MKPRLTRLQAVFLCTGLLIQHLSVMAQQASFIAADTVCVNVPVSFDNISTGATSYYWNFCVADIDATPVATNLGNVGGVLAAPAFMDYAEYNGTYYGYVVNNYPGGLVQLNFGNSLLNTPTATYLGNFGGAIPYSEEGIQLVEENGNWYAILVGGTPLSGGVSSIITISFGPNLGNTTPTATNWGNVGGLSYPTPLDLVQEGGNWYGFTLNATDNTVTRFSFGNSIANAPTGVNLGNLGGLNYPTGIDMVQNNGNWYLFEVSQSNNSLVRLDFGNSVLNTPTAVNLGNPGNTLNAPRDLTMIQYCGNTVGFAVNWQTSDLVRVNFPGGLTSVPTGVSLGDIGGMNAPQSISKIFQEGSDLFVFVTNILNNSITLVQFNGCTNSTIPASSAFTPPPVTYTTPGIYNVSLQTNVGLPSQSAFCKTVVVLPAPTVRLPTDTSFCAGGTVTLTATPSYPGATYTWGGTSGSGSVITVVSDSGRAVIDSAGKYWLTLGDYGCTLTDTVGVLQLASPSITLPRDTIFCDSGVLKYTTTQPVTFVWNTGSIADSALVTASGLYWLQLNQSGCTALDTIICKVIPSRSVYLGADTSFCGPGLLAYPDSDKVVYQWSSGSDSSSSPVLTSGPYWVAITDSGCTTRDTIQCTVIAKPSVQLPADTLVCDSATLSYVSPLPVTYAWNTGSDSSSTLAKTTGLYKLVVNNSGCVASDSSMVTVAITPTPNLPKDTSFCGAGTLTGSSPLPVTYTWSTGVTTPSATLTGTGLYWMQMDNQGCIARDSVEVTIIPLPLAVLGNDTTVCLSTPYILDAGNPGDTYDWQDGSTQQMFTVTRPGEYRVTITGSGCSIADSIAIGQFNLPYFSLGGNQPICPSEVIYLRPTPDSLSFTWQDGSTDTVFKVSNAGTYWAIATNACNSYSDTVIISKGICVVHVPSAFTPNGDGINDLFLVMGLEVVDQFSLRIFNRYGQEVFTTENKAQGWDGSFNGKALPAAAYVYELHFRYELTGKSYQMSGTVTLIR